MNRTSRTTLATLTAAAALGASGVAVLGTVPAQASGGSDYRVIRTGSCSGNAVWKLKAKADDGRIEVEFEVDSNRTGQVWDVRLRRNGNLVFSGKRTTQGASGSFSLERRISNSAGDDLVVGRATHGSQVCRGQVTFQR